MDLAHKTVNILYDTNTQMLYVQLIKTRTCSRHCHTFFCLFVSSFALTHTTKSHRGIETEKQITGTFMLLCMRYTLLCLFCQSMHIINPY